MKNENIKIVEIRDRATFIPAFAIRMIGDSFDERYLFNQAGYRPDPCILLISMQAPSFSARYSGDWKRHERTMGTAHKWIEENFDEIKNCQVIDVEYILKEVSQSCKSVREEQIEERLNGCENEDEQRKLESIFSTMGLITPKEYLLKYGSYICMICGKKRLNKFISVIAHDRPDGTSQINVKFCNDNSLCIDKAHVSENWINWPKNNKENSI